MHCKGSKGEPSPFELVECSAAKCELPGCKLTGMENVIWKATCNTGPIFQSGVRLMPSGLGSFPRLARACCVSVFDGRYESND
jgi:hypothetical protein